MALVIVLVVIGVALASALLLWLVGERWRFVRPSTWRMVRQGGLRRLFNLMTLHQYVYGRWTRQYLKFLGRLVPFVPERAKKGVADRYHGKVLTPEHAAAIITLDKDIPLTDLEQIVPYAVARDMVLSGPPDIAAYECACRGISPNPCTPTQVCMVIGQPFVDFIVDHHPKGARRLTQAEALELLDAEHKRGHVHSAWFKDAMMGRFYAICNCCKCCCGGIHAMVTAGIPMVTSSGYVAQFDKDLCTACLACVEACPFKALSTDDDCVEMNWDKCMGCGVCTAVCPSGAASLTRDERKGIPLDVRLLTA